MKESILSRCLLFGETSIVIQAHFWLMSSQEIKNQLRNYNQPKKPFPWLNHLPQWFQDKKNTDTQYRNSVKDICATSAPGRQNSRAAHCQHCPRLTPVSLWPHYFSIPGRVTSSPVSHGKNKKLTASIKKMYFYDLGLRTFVGMSLKSQPRFEWIFL